MSANTGKFPFVDFALSSEIRSKHRLLWICFASYYLNLQEKILEEDNRCLAETHYQLGVAHSFSDDFDKAIDSFTAAMKVIEMRIANLEKRIKEKKEWTEEQRKKDGN